MPATLRPLLILEPHPPLSLQATQEGVASVDGGHDIRMTGMDQGRRTVPPAPAVPIRKLLNVARVDASSYCGHTVPAPAVPIRKLLNVARVDASSYCGHTVSPGIGQQPL